MEEERTFFLPVDTTPPTRLAVYAGDLIDIADEDVTSASPAVLRAMLRAYETAAIAAISAQLRAEQNTPDWAQARACGIAAHAGYRDVLTELGAVEAGSEDILLDGKLLTDYESRLAGCRPLNAPPLEV